MADEPIDNSKNGRGKGRTSRTPQRRARRTSSAASVDPSLVVALGKIPETRAEMVARAKKLARDPDYPSDETLRLISEILAAHLEFDGFSY